jgi:hypothetical protein
MFKFRCQKKYIYFEERSTPGHILHDVTMPVHIHTTEPTRLFLMCLFYFYETVCHSCRPSNVCIWTEIFKLKLVFCS